MLTIDNSDAGAHELDRGANPSHGGLAGKLSWQLALEKAYLEYQGNHASAHGSAVLSQGDTQSSAESERDIAPERSQSVQQRYIVRESMPSGNPVPGTVDSALHHSEFVSTSRFKSTGRPLATPTVGVSHRIQSRWNERALQITTPNQQHAAADQSAEKESLRLIKMGDGVQLSVRSGELDGEAVLRLSKEVQRILAERGHPLMRVSLNGESLWDAEHAPYGDDLAPECADYRINKTY